MDGRVPCSILGWLMVMMMMMFAILNYHTNGQFLVFSFQTIITNNNNEHLA